MDSVDFGGSVCRDTGVVVRRCECGFAGDFPKFGEFSDCEFGIFGVEACWFAEHCAAIPRLYKPSRSSRKDVRGKQESNGKKKSACFAWNDGRWEWRAEQVC